MITSIKEWKKINETILVPRNLDGRKEKLLKQNIQLLSQEVIKGNLDIDESFEGISEELVKVKEIIGNVWLTINKGYIPEWLKNVKIHGYFDVRFNDLTTLENCPQYVGGTFYCNNNLLTSLDYCPKYIGGDFYCYGNEKLFYLPKNITLEGYIFNNINDYNGEIDTVYENILVPRNIEGRKEKLRQDVIKLLSQEVIEGDLKIDESFENIPLELIKVKEIKGHVDLIFYKGYIPKWLKNIKIEGYFNCASNYLTSLENCPQYVEGSFLCNNNQLTSLEGCPKYIGGNLWCNNNKIKLELPKDIELKGSFYN